MAEDFLNFGEIESVVQKKGRKVMPKAVVIDRPFDVTSEPPVSESSRNCMASKGRAISIQE